MSAQPQKNGLMSFLDSLQDGSQGNFLANLIQAILSLFSGGKSNGNNRALQSSSNTVRETDGEPSEDTQETHSNTSPRSDVSVRGPKSPDTSQTEFNQVGQLISMRVSEDLASDFIAMNSDPKRFLSEGVFGIFEMSDSDFEWAKKGFVAGNCEDEEREQEYLNMSRDEFVKAQAEDILDSSVYNEDEIPHDLILHAKELLSTNGIADPDGNLANALAFRAQVVTSEMFKDPKYENGVLSFTMAKPAGM